MIAIPEILAEWTFDRIRALLAVGAYEDARFDWKETLREEHGDRFLKTAIGMANGSGGFLIIGVLNKRLNETGTKEINVQQQGVDRVLV